ncbi:MAG: hypothetical protein HZC41_12020 [Chloroflexi bacterium]|nr:hypothetical protein [Chloroflexota bacterium]
MVGKRGDPPGTLTSLLSRFGSSDRPVTPRYSPRQTTLKWYNFVQMLLILPIPIIGVGGLMLTTTLILLGPAYDRPLTLLLMGGAIIWGCIYWLLLPRDTSQGTAASPPITLFPTTRGKPAELSSTTAGQLELPIQRPATTAEPVPRTEFYLTLLRFAAAILAAGLFFLALALIIKQTATVNAGHLLIIGASVGVFPLSFIAYRAFRSDQRTQRLEEDFELLGMEKTRVQALQSYKVWDYAVHILMAVLFTLIGLAVLFTDLDPSATGQGTGIAGFINQLIPDASTQTTRTATILDLLTINANSLIAMQYGVLGAYLFAVQLIYRRYTMYDLHPTVYMYCGLTILAGLIFNYVAFETIFSLSPPTGGELAGAGKGITAIIAFALGFFPYLAIRWLDRVAYRTLNIGQRRAEDLPLGLLDGVSDLHETRLRDTGIDNIQNLASVDIAMLLLNTNFSAQEVIDWIDQSILYLHLDPSEISGFRRVGIRTVSDFHDIWKPCYGVRPKPNGASADPNASAGSDQTTENGLTDLRKELALRFQSTPERLDTLYAATLQGTNLHYVLVYWKNAKDWHSKTSALNLLARYNTTLEYAAQNYISKTPLEWWEEAEDYRQRYREETEEEPTFTNPMSVLGLAYLRWTRTELKDSAEAYLAALQGLQNIRDQVTTNSLPSLAQDLLQSALAQLPKAGITMPQEGLESALETIKQALLLSLEMAEAGVKLAPQVLEGYEDSLAQIKEQVDKSETLKPKFEEVLLRYQSLKEKLNPANP